MRRSMNPVQVELREDGEIWISQASDDAGAHSVAITAEQAPVLIAWLQEAAGLEPKALTERAPTYEEIRTAARMFRRLEERQPGGPQEHDSAMEAVRVALEWASGESEFAPDEWLFDAPEA